MLKEYDAAVVACFGTGNPALFNKTFYHLYEELSRNIRIPCYLILTSSLFFDSLRNKGMVKGFKELKELGYRRILVIPAILADGKEYQKLLEEVEAAGFERATVYRPMLEEYAEEIASMLSEILPKDKSSYILLGHGSKKSTNQEYANLKEELVRIGRDDIDVSLMIDDEYKEEAVYFPLFLCAGHHYQEFISRHPDNEYYQKSLAEYDEIIEMIRKRIGR